MAVLCEALVCGRSLAGIADSNSAGRWMNVCLFECCVLSGRSLCDGLIPHQEESYSVCEFVCECECMCVTECDHVQQ